MWEKDNKNTYDGSMIGVPGGGGFRIGWKGDVFVKDSNRAGNRPNKN